MSVYVSDNVKWQKATIEQEDAYNLYKTLNTPCCTTYYEIKNFNGNIYIRKLASKFNFFNQDRYWFEIIKF